MSQTRHFARGLGLAFALTTASPLALGATPRHKKPGAAKPAKAKPTKADDDAAPVKLEEEPETKPAPQPEPAATEAPKPAEPEPEPESKQLTPAAEAAPAIESSDTTPDQEAAALGRRELARLAAGRVAVSVALSAGVVARSFSYSDPVGYALAPYHLPAAPMASFELEAYPAAASDIPVLRDLGFRGHISRAFAFDSNTPQNVTLETSWTRFGGDLRQRLLVPGSHPFEAGVLVGADATYFGIVAKAPVPALLPASRSVALRFGLDARLLVAWRLSFLLGGAYLAVTSRGEIYEHFRKPRVAGVDSNVGFAVNVGSGFEIRLSGRYTRYFSSFKPALGDRFVAGGALDEQWQFGLGARYAH
jgi:hypothetical protein